MKRMLLSVVFVALFAGGVDAQSGSAKRSVLFTLGEKEAIESGEYFVMQKVNGNRFACVVWDAVKKTNTLVFNGKRVVEEDGLYVHYLDVNEENGYIVEYGLQDRRYVNTKGKVLGPFDYISQWGEGDKFVYYKEEGYCVYSKGVVGGPFEKVDFPSKTSAYADCEYLYLLADRWYAHYKNGSNKMARRASFSHYERDEKWYVNINGVESRGYGEVDGYSIHVTESGKYAYEYRDGWKFHVNINGEESREYDRVGYIELTESGKYAYKYQENKKWHVNINGKESRGYDGVGNVELTENGKYAYAYQENGRWHVNINGEESEEYHASAIYRGFWIYLTESGKYAYSYHDSEDRKSYVNIDGKESEGWDLEITDDGNFSFYYEGDDGKIYRNNNGEKSETGYLAGMRFYGEAVPFRNTRYYYDANVGPDNIEIYSADREHSLYSAYEYEYVVVDGVRCGKSPALYAWYDKGRNAFVWNAVEGRELVLYEYGF